MGLGVLCLETYWSEDPRDLRHSRGLLEVVEHNVDDFLGVHRHVATRRDLERYVTGEWARDDAYDLLYIATHGDAGRLLDEQQESITLTWLAARLKGSCRGRVVMLGACEIMTASQSQLAWFVEQTSAAALIGYASTIDWIEAAQMELSVLGALAREGPGATGVWRTTPDELLETLYEEHQGFADRVGWQFVPGDQQPTRVPRRELADGARTALSELERIASDQSVAPDARERALDALGALRDRWSLRTFTCIARETDAAVELRVAAVRALGCLEGHTARASLAKLAEWIARHPSSSSVADARLLEVVDEQLNGRPVLELDGRPDRR